MKTIKHANVLMILISNTLHTKTRLPVQLQYQVSPVFQCLKSTAHSRESHTVHDNLPKFTKFNAPGILLSAETWQISRGGKMEIDSSGAVIYLFFFKCRKRFRLTIQTLNFKLFAIRGIKVWTHRLSGLDGSTEIISPILSIYRR